MKKIMFNDKYGLTQAALDGSKTMTRRTITQPNNSVLFSSAKAKNGKLRLSFFNNLHELVYIESCYHIGEVVAIAQSYYDCGICLFPKITDENGNYEQGDAGDYNKMFVKAELMPHHIRITNIRVERLQDISDEDCLREGICSIEVLWASSMETSDGYLFLEEGKAMCYKTPQQAFAGLIDKVSGKGTWERNPFVFVYEFEKVD